MAKNKRRGQHKKGQKPGAYSPQQKSKIPAIVTPILTADSKITKGEIEDQRQQPAPESQWGGRVGAWFRRGSLVVRAVKVISALVAAGASALGLYIPYQDHIVSNRAIVHIANIEVNLPILNFTLQKTGGLPATAVEVRVKERRFPMQTVQAVAEILLEKGDRIDGKGGETIHKVGETPITSGEPTYKFGVALHEFGPEEAERLRSEEDVLMVMGVIIYDDGTWFRSRQEVPYCFVHNPHLSGFQWYACPTKRVEKVQGRGGDVVFQGKEE